MRAALVAALAADALAVRSCAWGEASGEAVGALAPLAPSIAREEVVQVLEVQAGPTPTALSEVRAFGAAQE